MAAPPLFVWMCPEGSYQFSQGEQSRGVDPTRRRCLTWRRWCLAGRQRLGPRCGNKHAGAIWQLDIEFGFTRPAAVVAKHLDHLAAEWVMRMRDPHDLLLLTSYCRSSLLTL